MLWADQCILRTDTIKPLLLKCYVNSVDAATNEEMFGRNYHIVYVTLVSFSLMLAGEF